MANFIKEISQASDEINSTFNKVATKAAQILGIQDSLRIQPYIRLEDADFLLFTEKTTAAAEHAAQKGWVIEDAIAKAKADQGI